MTRFEPASDLTTLRAQCAVIDDLVERWSAGLSIAAPDVSGWSPEQHIAHVALANELVLRNVKSLVVGRGMLVVQGGEPHPEAVAALLRARLPRGRAQAPRMVRPPERVERELLLQWLADGRRELDTLEPAQIVANDLKVPHQLLGPLDGPQWLRFAVVHTNHHLEIALEALARAPEAPIAAALPALPPLAVLAGT